MPAPSTVPLPLDDARIAVIGLGYVGLPLAVAFGAVRSVTGFDIDARRVAELDSGMDRTRELDAEEIAVAAHLRFSNDPRELAACDIFIVAVPTPIDAGHNPDLGPLREASALVARAMRRGALVIYESTVYPGTTEEICAPILEQGSGLR